MMNFHLQQVDKLKYIQQESKEKIKKENIA